MIKYPSKIDKSLYKDKTNKPKIFYGLNPEIKFCRRCTYSNQKPTSEKEYKHKKNTKKTTLLFNIEGVCSACKVLERKEEIDWELRKYKLKKLCDKYRSRNGKYDCLVPGSGGKDSFYAAYKLKYEFNMNPLTVTWSPHIYTNWGWKNFNSWIDSGFANYLLTPNGKTHRILTRLALEKLFHPFQPFMLGQQHFPKRTQRKGRPDQDCRGRHGGLQHRLAPGGVPRGRRAPGLRQDGPGGGNPEAPRRVLRGHGGQGVVLQQEPPGGPERGRVPRRRAEVWLLEQLALPKRGVRGVPGRVQKDRRVRDGLLPQRGGPGPVVQHRAAQLVRLHPGVPVRGHQTQS